MKKVIIVGAASGMGKETARLFANEGYTLGLADERLDLLEQVSTELPGNIVIRKIDVVRQFEAREILTELIAELGGVDIFIYCAGIADKSGVWENEYKLHQVNAVGFAALANMVFNYYRTNDKSGQIVGISSLLAMRGFRQAIPYCASKAFMRSYMQGLRHEAAANHLGITITDIRPGFVKTRMIENQKGLFWVSPVEKAAAQIASAISRKKKYAYISGRWEIVGLIWKYLPDWIVHNLKTVA